MGEVNQNKPSQATKSLASLAEIGNLTIPNYQRPYKWKANNVIQLLDDIYEHLVTNKKNKYRVGSVIIHEDEVNGEKCANIVDGQQRLTTLAIILYTLESNKNSFLLNQTYNSKISKDNLVYNFRVIENWLSKIIDKEEFKKLLLEKCEFVVFTVYNQEEAFQLFDASNARGKSLEAYDLLKAFHLREMRQESEANQINVVKNWEKAVATNQLNIILGDHLFRIRCWARNEWKYTFTKDDIDEFKGISLQNPQKYPFETSFRLLDGVIENVQNDKILKNNQIAQIYPFSITMPIINGKRFFEYVDYFIQFKYHLFEQNENADFTKFYKEYCIGGQENAISDNNFYSRGDDRGGDQKVLNLYENILLLFIDRFSLDYDFKFFYESFYKLFYHLRCRQRPIGINECLNYLKNDNASLFMEVSQANSLAKLSKWKFKEYNIDIKRAESIDNNEMPVKGLKVVKEFIYGK